MTLDRIASAAAEDLRDRTRPDARAMLEDLHRLRRRRTAERSAVLLVVLALALGGLALVRPGRDRPEPAPPPVVRNGVIAGTPGDGAGIDAVGGEPLVLPRDSGRFTRLQFTDDGHLVYRNDRGGLSIADIEAGTSRVLSDCPDDLCLPALSPDGTTLAYADGSAIVLRALDDDAVRTIPGGGRVAAPTWAPSGDRLAFVRLPAVIRRPTVSGELYVAAADGSRSERITGGTSWAGTSWSPDGNRLAVLLSRRQPGSAESFFTVAVVDVDSRGLSRLHAAGHCVCLGIPAPSLAWSPDGELIAVAVTQGESGPGVYTVRPDGTDWTKRWSGVYSAIAWQPVRD